MGNRSQNFISLFMMILLILLSTTLDIKNNDSTEFPEIPLTNDVNITAYQEYQDGLLAIGSKENYPYIQVITNQENQTINKQATNYHNIQGKIIAITTHNYYLSTKIQDDNHKIVYQDFFVSSQEIIPFYKKQLTMNYTKGVVIWPKYLVIHETGNPRVGANAYNHYRYWSSNDDANASTHFVVDSKEIYQMLELNQMAWHVGDNKGFSKITNSNSIGIEIAINADGDYNQAKQNAIELTAQLMRFLKMDISQLKTHYDASGKDCPQIILENNAWDDFAYQVNLRLNSYNNI